MEKMTSKPKGQALVIVLLILGVVLTVGLSVVSQAINDVRLSEREEEASRAFSAAESGVEQALSGGTLPMGPQQVGNATYQVERSPLLGGTEFLFPNDYVSGDVATLYLVEHNTDGSLDTGCLGGNCYEGSEVRLCWGTAGTSPSTAITPAMEVGVLYLDGGVYKLAREAVDPNGPRTSSNRFGNPSGGSCTVAGRELSYAHNISFPSLGVTGRPILFRIKLHYNYSAADGDVPHPIGVNAVGGDGFPTQGSIVESVGTFGDSTQKVQVTQLHPDAPPIFDYALYAEEGGLIKN